jgi:cytochrome bd-type quinol oxidase subunit 2
VGFRSIRRFIDARPVLSAIGTSIGVIGLVVFVGVIDVRRVVTAYERSRSATLAALVVAVAAALATVLAAIVYVRRRDRLGSTARRVLGWTAIVWAVVFVVAFAWTHSRRRDDDLTPITAGVVGYCLVIVAIFAAVTPFAMRAQARGRPHEPRDRVEVWYVREDDPFFIAYCECGWVGRAYDESEPDAREKAFRDAREHGTNVAPEVAYPLGS